MGDQGEPWGRPESVWKVERAQRNEKLRAVQKSAARREVDSGHPWSSSTEHNLSGDTEG